MPHAPKDNSAQVAAQEEAARQARIDTGRHSIDNSFTQFNPAYYDNYKNTYEGYYNPQVDQQFQDASKNLKYGLARTGTLDSTNGATRFSRLAEAYSNQRQQVGSDAQGAVDTLRGNIADTKSRLYAQNNAAADPSAAASDAANQVGALQTAPKYSALGDLFGGLVNSGASYYYGRQQQLPASYGGYSPSSSAPSASGSGYVVGH